MRPLVAVAVAPEEDPKLRIAALDALNGSMGELRLPDRVDRLVAVEVDGLNARLDRRLDTFQGGPVIAAAHRQTFRTARLPADRRKKCRIAPPRRVSARRGVTHFRRTIGMKGVT